MLPSYVVCFYADLGNYHYLPLIRRMCQSAKSVLPECKTVLLTTSDDHELHGYFDSFIMLDIEIAADNLCASRARTTTSWQLQSNGLTYFVDPDIVFRKAPEIDPDADVMLSWGRKRPAQPVNSGLVIAKPGHLDFWKRYAAAAINLPKPLNAWWCDQLAYNLLVGAVHQPGDVIRCLDANVKLIDSRIMCATPEEGTDESWTLHYKGQRKWKPELLTNQRQEKSGAGNSLAACA